MKEQVEESALSLSLRDMSFPQANGICLVKMLILTLFRMEQCTGIALKKMQNKRKQPKKQTTTTTTTNRTKKTPKKLKQTKPKQNLKIMTPKR